MTWTAQLIKAAREERGLTRAQLAELLGTNTRRIIAIESGDDTADVFTARLTQVFTEHCRDCGAVGCEYCEPAHYLTQDMRYIAEDAESLSDVAERVFGWVEEHLSEGWELLQPLNDGYLHLVRGLHA
jgi:DNA-binding XRE family transcriptional regulator